MIEFQVDKAKTINALLFLIREAGARGRLPSQYDLVKALFLADRAHLNAFGRPITFDKYVAMTHGPVASFAYDSLKPNFNWASLGRNCAPWKSRADGRVHRFSLAGEAPDERKLSKSDREHLSDALVTVLSLTFGQIRRITHEDRAYVAAWRDEENSSAFPMDMELLLDEPDGDAAEDLRYLSHMKRA